MFGLTIIFFAFWLGSPLKAEAADPLCNERNSLGSEIMSGESESNSAQRSEDFENRWRKIIDPLSSTHRNLQGQIPALAGAVQIRNQFFSTTFGRNGDIVQICSQRRLIQQKLRAHLEAQKSLQQISPVEQCSSYEKIKSNYNAALSLYSDYKDRLEKGFSTRLNAQGIPEGSRLQDFFRYRQVNQNILQQNGAALAVYAGPLRKEVLALWGNGSNPKPKSPLPLDSSGYYSRFSLEAIEELNRSKELQKNFSTYSRDLENAFQHCEFSYAKKDPTDDNKKQTDDQKPPAGKNQKDGGNFFSRNWGWLAGGAVIGGGGYYLYHKSQSVKEEQQALDKKQMDYNAMLAAQASQQSNNSITTQTSTSTATDTSTDSGLIDSDGDGAAITMKAKELQPFEMQIMGDGEISLETMPQGSFFISEERLFRWLPKKGDAGMKNFSIRSGEIRRRINIDVKAADLEAGPPDLFPDGDVGYVFVHGAGMDDRCKNRSELNSYWGSSPHVISPSENNRTVACYDGSQSVATQAAKVAQQILEAPCGRYGRCIVITHSMGGLLMEHMFIHTRAPKSDDPDPKMFEQRDLYQKAKNRTLFVISLASAAGGSKVANVLQNEGNHDKRQKLVGKLSRWIGMNNNAFRNLQSNYASTVVAPKNEDPGIPFFMVGGYSKRTLREEGKTWNFMDYVLEDEIDAKIFNSDPSCSALDYIAEFGSRSDGLVDFRSSCGIADGNENAGPGHKASLNENFRYCATAPKKPNHYAWFLTNLNHMEIALPSVRCKLKENPCETRLKKGDTFEVDPAFQEQDAMHVIRALLTRNRSGFTPMRNVLDLGM